MCKVQQSRRRVVALLTRSTYTGKLQQLAQVPQSAMPKLTGAYVSRDACPDSQRCLPCPQDLAMQAAASSQAIVVSVDDVPEEEMEKERRIEMEKEDIQSKPEAIRCAGAGSVS